MRRVLVVTFTLALTITTALLWALPAHADPGPLVYSPEEYHAEIAQGSSVSFDLMIAADNGANFQYTAKLVGIRPGESIPDEWLTFSPPLSTVGKGSSETTAVSITVPPDAAYCFEELMRRSIPKKIIVTLISVSNASVNLLLS